MHTGGDKDLEPPEASEHRSRLVSNGKQCACSLKWDKIRSQRDIKASDKAVNFRWTPRFPNAAITTFVIIDLSTPAAFPKTTYKRKDEIVKTTSSP